MTEVLELVKLFSTGFFTNHMADLTSTGISLNIFRAAQALKFGHPPSHALIWVWVIPALGECIDVLALAFLEIL